VFITNSIQDVVDLCEALFPDKEWFVIGGESIYKQFLDANLVDEMRLTIVDDDKDGDTYFPTFDNSQWAVYYETLTQKSDSISFVFEILKKK
jgi:dihydrofolate reductase